jgi:hypothetical protein
VLPSLAIGLLLAVQGRSLQESSLNELLARVPAIEQASDNQSVLDLYSALTAKRSREAISKLMPYLGDPRPRVRAFASAVLDNLPLEETELDGLIAAHQAGDRCALHSIALIGTPRALRYWVTHLDGQADLQVDGSRILRDSLALGELAEFLRSASPRPSDAVDDLCWMLKSPGGSAAAPPLLSIAYDPALPLMNRLAAVHSLGCVGAAAAFTKPSLQTLAASDPRFADQVLETLDRIDQKHTLRMSLVDFARARAYNNVHRRGVGIDLAIESFDELGEVARPAVPLLLPYLEMKSLSQHDDSKVHATAALGAIGDPRAIPALIKALDDPDDWRTVLVASQSLGRIGAVEALPALDRVAASHWFVTVRQMARYVAAELRAPAKTLPPPYALNGHWLRVQPPFPRATRDLTTPPDVLTQIELAQHAVPSRLRVPPCDLPYPKPLVVTPTTGLRTAEGIYLGTDRGEWGGSLVFQRGNDTEIVLPGNIASVVKLGSNVVAVATRGASIHPDGPLPGEKEPEDMVISTGPESGGLFRIERRPDGAHKAILWKILPGFCGPVGLLKDGRLYLHCQAGDVIVRQDGTLQSPESAPQ